VANSHFDAGSHGVFLADLDRMRDADDKIESTKTCELCGGHAFYWHTAILPGDPDAPRGSRRRHPHFQPAWKCLDCGHLEPHERRIRVAHPQVAADKDHT